MRDAPHAGRGRSLRAAKAGELLGGAVVDRPQDVKDLRTKLAALASSASEKPATGSPKSRKSIARLSNSSWSEGVQFS
jgi:hypothetical protein